MQIDECEGFDEELRKKLRENLVRLYLADIVGALCYAVQTATSDSDLVERLAAALEGQRWLREVAQLPAAHKNLN